MSSNRKLNIKERLMARRKRFRKPGRVVSFALILTFFGGYGITYATDIPVEQYKYINTAENGVKLNFVGDLMIGRTFSEYGSYNNGSRLLDRVGRVLNSADRTFANLENAVCDSEKVYQPITKEHAETNLYTNFGILQNCVSAGVNVFGCANDHMYDYGEEAVTDLIRFFDKEKITYSGIANNKEELFSDNHIININGKKIGFYSITDQYPEEAVSFDKTGKPVVLGTAFQEYSEKILELDRKTDFTVIYMHWGIEDSMDIDQRQILLAHQLIDAGADIIIGTHPQVLQSIEKYKSGLIIYSLGNFVYDQGYSQNNNSVIVQCTVDEKMHADFRFVPLRIREGQPEVTENGLFRYMINSKLIQRLDKTDYRYDENGCLHVEIDMESVKL